MPRGVLARVRAAVGVATVGRGARIVFFGLTAVTLLLYLVGVGDLWITAGPGPLTSRVAPDLLRAFAVDGLGQFGAVGVVYLGGPGLTYLFSPIDLVLALLVAGLVGTNGALTYRGLRQPRGRRLGVSTVVLAGLPPLVLVAGILGPTVVYLADAGGGELLPVGLRLLVPLGVLALLPSIARIADRLPTDDA